MELKLNPDERELLLGVLERELRETRVEVRRTETASFRDGLVHDEDVLRGLIDKLRSEAT